MPDPDQESPDLVLRSLSHRFPEHFVRGLHPEAEQLLYLGKVDTQLSSRQRQVDRVFDVVIDGVRLWQHIEWQVRMPVDMPFRMFEYEALLAIHAEEEARLTGQPVPKIEGVVVLLAGRDAPWPAKAEYRISPRGDLYSAVQYRIEPVYQRTIAEIEAMPAGWQVFAPLAVDADRAKLQHVIDRLHERSRSEQEFEHVGSAMAVIARCDGRKRNLMSFFTDMMPREVLENNDIWDGGMKKGRRLGLREGARAMLLEILDARHLKLTTQQLQTVRECQNRRQLLLWGRRAVTAKRASELFRPSKPH